VVVADTYGHSAFMDKIQKAQVFTSTNDDNPLSDFKKIMEINPHHRVNQIILDRIKVLSLIFRITLLINRFKSSFSCFMRQRLSTQDLQPETLTNLSSVSIKFTPRRWV